MGRPFEEMADSDEMIKVASLARDVYKSDSIKKISRMPFNIPGEARILYFDYTVIPIHDGENRVDGIVIYSEDVTEQRNRESEERREKLKLMVEHADQVALALYDAQTGELIQASPRYQAILERARYTESGKTASHKFQQLNFIAHNEQEAAKVFNSVIESGAPVRLREMRIKLGSDEMETVWDLSLNPIPFIDGDPSITHYVVVSAVEITEQVRAREELERLDHLKNEFLSLASHELRTPLVPLMGYSDILAKIIAEREGQDERDNRIGEFTAKFRKQLRHLNRLIDDLFDLTRLQSGKLSIEKSRVDVTKALHQAIEEARMLGSDHDIHLKIPKDEKSVFVMGDEGRLIQVVLNLLSNSIKHASKNKRIDVRLNIVLSQKPSKQQQTTTTDSKQALIEVQDYGTGIPAEELDLIFTPFYQVANKERASRSGLGLGLYISKQIIEQHDGTIEARSTKGEGAIFTIRLPLAADATKR